MRRGRPEKEYRFTPDLVSNLHPILVHELHCFSGFNTVKMAWVAGVGHAALVRVPREVLAPDVLQQQDRRRAPAPAREPAAEALLDAHGHAPAEPVVAALHVPTSKVVRSLGSAPAA